MQNELSLNEQVTSDDTALNGISFKKENDYVSYRKLNLNSSFTDIYWNPFSLEIKLTDELLKKQKTSFVNEKAETKVFLEDLHFVIITKIDNNYRLKNLQQVVSHLNRFFSNTIYIAEYDTESKINFDGNYEKFLINPVNKGFWRNYAANQLYKKIGPIKLLFNIESDVIFDPDGIINCYNLLKTDKFKFCMPFNGFQFWMNEKASNKFITEQKLPSVWKHKYKLSNDLEDFYFDILVENIYLHPGFCYMVDFKTFKKLGLENQNFIKHGYDDTERVARFLKNGYEIFYSNHFCYHLWHPRNKTNEYYNTDNDNKKEFLRIIKMSPIEFKNELKNWTWIKNFD